MGDSISRPRKSGFWVLIASAMIGFAMLAVPFSAHADPFGGRASFVKKCYNNTIYALLGPPRGGAYVWTPSTRTYKFGKPAKAGQWLLGLKSIPFLCLYSKQPIVTLPAIGILMMGSSSVAPSPIPKGFGVLIGGGGTSGGGGAGSSF